MAKIDLTGKKYRFFTILGRNEEKTKASGKNVFWNCQCECGKIFTSTTTDINKEKVKSCGCKKSQLLSEAHLQDLTGQIFGELFVLERDFNHPQNGAKQRTYWLCQCSCGNIISVERTHLVCRGQASCGCKQSIGELNINKILSENNIKYKTQYTTNDLKTDKNGYLRFDFALLDKNNIPIRLVEFDGPQHQIEDSFFNDNLKIRQQRDQIKNKYAKANNIPLVRIPYYKRDCLTLEDIIGEEFVI